MRRAVRMVAPCTDGGTIWLCFQVLIHFPCYAPTPMTHQVVDIFMYGTEMNQSPQPFAGEPVLSGFLRI